MKNKAIALWKIEGNDLNFRILNLFQNMSPQIIITLILLLSIIGIVAGFYNEKKSKRKVHNQSIADLEVAICTNQKQIRLRSSHLDGYDFLKFNLEEVLIVQPDIRI